VRGLQIGLKSGLPDSKQGSNTNIVCAATPPPEIRPAFSFTDRDATPRSTPYARADA
jgi:hypothetical protein